MKQKLLLLSLVTALSGAIFLNQVDADNTRQTQRTGENEKGKSMKIRIKLDSKTLTATLEDNATTRDFVALLPLTLTLRDYNRTEKISDLPKKLSTEGAPSGSDPNVGDIAYYAPWGNIAMFYHAFDYSAGLVKLGKLDGDADSLRNTETTKATVELIKE